MNELNPDAVAVHSNDLPISFFFGAPGFEYTGYHNFLPDDKMPLSLYVGATGTEVFEGAFKQPSVGGEMGILGAHDPLVGAAVTTVVPAGTACGFLPALAGTSSRGWGWSFSHHVTITEVSDCF